MLAIAAEIPVDYYNSTIQGEVLGIEKVGFYPSCRKCEKKMEAAAASNVVECTTWHLKQKLNSCSNNWYVHILLESANKAPDVSRCHRTALQSPPDTF